MTSNSKAVLTYSFVIADPDPQSIFTGLNYNHVKFKNMTRLCALNEFELAFSFWL